MRRKELTVCAFEKIIFEKLSEREYHGDWMQKDPQYMFAWLLEEVTELQRAIMEHKDKLATPHEVAREAADVAICAMAVAEICGGLVTDEHEH